MVCAICGKKVHGIGLDPLRRGENRICLWCLGKYGLEGVKEILRKRWEKA